jgi:hypothetical protein
MANNNPLQVDLNDTIGTFRQKVNTINENIGAWDNVNQRFDVTVPTGETESGYSTLVTSINTINEKIAPEAIRGNISLVASNSSHTQLSYNPTTGIFNFISSDSIGAGSGAVSASNVLGTLSTTNIPDLDASKIVSGTIDSDRLPTISATVSSTDAVPEGTTNLYYTDSRVRNAISAGTGISYNSSTGVISATGISLNAGTGVIINSNTISIGQAVATNSSVKFNSVVGSVEDIRQSSSVPTTKSNSEALAKGSMYYNTTDNELQIYNGSGWDTMNNLVTSVDAGSGISVDTTTGDITITNSGVRSLSAGTGISLNAATGDVSVTNSGVTSIVAGSGISINSSTGAVTVTADVPTTYVSNIIAGDGIAVDTGTGTVTISTSSSSSTEFSRNVTFKTDASSGLPSNGTWSTTSSVMPLAIASNPNVTRMQSSVASNGGAWRDAAGVWRSLSGSTSTIATNPGNITQIISYATF